MIEATERGGAKNGHGPMPMLRFLPYAASGVLVGVLAWFIHVGQADKYQAQIEALDLSLRNCRAATLNIEEDKKSDQEIDNTDLNNFVIPDSWLRGPR